MPNRPALPSEGRGQPRIQAQVPIRIAGAGSTQPRRALLANLSWGGAQIHCEDEPGGAGDPLEVELPYHHGDSIRIESEILRVTLEDDGRYLVAVRFSSVSPKAEAHLENVLEMLLSGTGGGRRAHPRLAQRLEIYFDDPADIRATLEDISHGGLSVTVPYSFTVSQSVQLTVYGPAGIGELRLRARVMHQELENGKVPLYRVGLKFEHPAGDLQKLVDHFLHKLSTRQALAARQWKTDPGPEGDDP